MTLGGGGFANSTRSHLIGRATNRAAGVVRAPTTRDRKITRFRTSRCQNSPQNLSSPEREKATKRPTISAFWTGAGPRPITPSAAIPRRQLRPMPRR